MEEPQRAADEDAGAMAFVAGMAHVSQVCPVVMVAVMALATQLALMTPSVLQSLATLATCVIPEAPALQESHEAQLVTFYRSWGPPRTRV